MSRARIEARKVLTAADREGAKRVIEAVFKGEKNWVNNVDGEIPADPAATERMSWFMVAVDGEPAGVIRLAYDPPMELPPEMEVQLERPIDLSKINEGGRRFVEIGRFMILPEQRRNMRVALQLMKAAITEVVERGYTHFVTDVYEGDPHSPLRFHTRVLGFERIGTHRHGELNYEGMRIILVLDIARGYRRLMVKKDRVFRELTAGIQHLIEKLPLTPKL